MGFIKVGSKTAEVKDGEKIKGACESLDILFACQEGVCGTCEVSVLKGKENLSPLTKEEKDFGIDPKSNKRLACQCSLKRGTVELVSELYS